MVQPLLPPRLVATASLSIPEANPLSYNSGSALAILALWLLRAPFSTWP
ncbi:MAG TPA: hypothetical protein VKA09_00430 [Nitrososphaeraceae archaeon]|nr:hypothetical protein [Nitrososphaeraceae archaeon]